MHGRRQGALDIVAVDGRRGKALNVGTPIKNAAVDEQLPSHAPQTHP